ncbi:hypothetical protein FRC15_006772, partial [Serendipita sp. 397]
MSYPEIASVLGEYWKAVPSTDHMAQRKSDQAASFRIRILNTYIFPNLLLIINGLNGSVQCV